ncbi:peptide chain release factor N(5)-glutamine methyltransferase [Halopseudomonas aestusnigri]|uniref:peptide chain release factor N(5)-glutamine methyltransferase n=1 Tax=Halopseudomonas aestusnigri TaxID=857252 RepID=UPI000C9633B5|nr:peptide chain release factor N(5)-glutamine methyltransferase [Halopseudomonas aestusnigri]MAS65791.1 protein-(glutamine-N5) methyltransferase, release factor-specific [Pseudomonadales bacterium]MDL2200129.1 peptide chain release factor N(5)-glutamine methyltransferase [Halopseudomonas aestusnigri]|tara:strand:+ start:5593 stop:6426 length:834 start_codon:yes stop_codon:yes gene_type:complete
MTPTLAEVLASAELPDSDTARLDAELLLCHAIGKPRTYLRTWPERRPDAEQLRRFEQLLSQRRSGVPIAYLLGEQGFWSLQLEVSESTLIPRPDTERLVEVALELGPQGAAEVLDLGTGTGAIALALAAERPDWQLTGVDRVAEAVALARRNAERLRIGNACFEQSDWFTALAGRRFDLIVSNPPYIAADDPHLQQGDVRFEPGSALVSGADGLDDIRTLVQLAPAHLQATGWLLFEHGWQQADAVAQLLRDRGFEQVQSWRDLGGQQRVTGGQWRG